VPNGTDPFEVRVKGSYLVSNTQIYFGGRPITNTVVSADKKEATGTIPAFATILDPALQLFSPAKTVSGLDGGLSEALHFFSTKKDVTIRAVNMTRKYGQANPESILFSGATDQSLTILIHRPLP
jgi:hypothetical protein